MIFGLNNNATAQAACTSPKLVMQNPVLVSGTALAQGSTYKFANVIPGVDAFILVKKFNGGATLVAMETVGQGYNDAWQPIIKGPGTPFGNRSWIDFVVSFKTTAGAKYTFPCLDISSIDVDGDGGRIGEFVESDGHFSYNIPDPTLLTISNLGSGRIRAQGPVINRPSIDTSAMDVRAHFYFNGRDTIALSLGSFVYNNGYTGAAATERLNCVYFSRIVGSYLVLPVDFLSFEANLANRHVALNWKTTSEISNSHFEVERSFDNVRFTKIAEVASTSQTAQDINAYKLIDQSAELKNNDIAYYRIRQIGYDGKNTTSKIIGVRLKSDKEFSITVGPNPFVDRLQINLQSTEMGSAEIRISNMNGNKILSRTVQLSNGQNSIQVNQLANYPTGMYMVQLYRNGSLVTTQKMIKM